MTTDVDQDVIRAGESTGLDSPAPNIVKVGACRCPRREHAEGDLVVLAPKIPLNLGIAALSAMNRQTNVDSMAGEIAGIYLRNGIIGWTFTDAKGELETIDEESIARLLPYDEGGLEVAEAADALYQDALMRPLRKRFPERFPSGPTDRLTPLNHVAGSKPRTRSARSSRNGTGGKRSAGRGR